MVACESDLLFFVMKFQIFTLYKFLTIFIKKKKVFNYRIELRERLASLYFGALLLC